MTRGKKPLFKSGFLLEPSQTIIAKIDVLTGAALGNGGTGIRLYTSIEHLSDIIRYRQYALTFFPVDSDFVQNLAPAGQKTDRARFGEMSLQQHGICRQLQHVAALLAACRQFKFNRVHRLVRFNGHINDAVKAKSRILHCKVVVRFPGRQFEPG